MIERRDIMKLETSEGLYTEVSHIISNFFIFAPLALIENLVFTFVLYAMGGLSWSNYGVLWEWSTLVALAMDAFFSCAAAASKNADEALVKAMPFLFLFVIYN